ncbi:MAG TPA: class A beta-lactamase [Rhizomicrobium sp.]|nr:class A beta-lactamase [Rhizomicrobium sp.]
MSESTDPSSREGQRKLPTRRAALGAAALLISAPARAQIHYAEPSLALKDLEARTGSRIGVAAVDSGSGRFVSWREGERFIMCSTFKFSLAAAVLSRADAGTENLGRVIHYSRSDLLDVSPATTRNLQTGMRVVDLCEAVVLYSDNTAANLLLSTLNGPQGLTSWWRQIGDTVTRLDRREPALNLPDGIKDTTTPAAMLGNLKAVLLGNLLSNASRARLMGWMADSTTGSAMLRAGIPSNWAVGDKTGRWSSTDPSNGATNDIAILTPPGGRPILVAAYTTGGRGDQAGRESVLADIGRIVADRFT